MATCPGAGYSISASGIQDGTGSGLGPGPAKTATPTRSSLVHHQWYIDSVTTVVITTIFVVSAVTVKAEGVATVVSPLPVPFASSRLVEPAATSARAPSRQQGRCMSLLRVAGRTGTTGRRTRVRRSAVDGQ